MDEGSKLGLCLALSVQANGLQFSWRRHLPRCCNCHRRCCHPLPANTPPLSCRHNWYFARRAALCALHAACCTLHTATAHIARQPLDAATCRTPPRRTPHAACCMLHAATTSLHTACHPPARYTHCSQNVAPAFIWRTCTLAAVRACKFMCVCACACACVVGVSTRTNDDVCASFIDLSQ